MAKSIAELANLINEEFTKQGDKEILMGLRKQMTSNNADDNKAAFNTLAARGVNINEEEFRIIREFMVFETQKMSNMMKSTGITYFVIGIAVAAMSVYLRNRLSVFGLIAAVFFCVLGYAMLKKSKAAYH